LEVLGCWITVWQLGKTNKSSRSKPGLSRPPPVKGRTKEETRKKATKHLRTFDWQSSK
jgi:hypothetical protein